MAAAAEIEGGLLHFDFHSLHTGGTKAPCGDWGFGCFDGVNLGTRFGRRCGRNRLTKIQLWLKPVLARTSAPHVVSFHALEDFAAPIGLDGQIGFAPELGGSRDRNSVWAFRQARIAKAAGTRFGAINGAALQAGLYHRLVFALRTVPEAEPRGGYILWRQLRQQHEMSRSLWPIVHCEYVSTRIISSRNGDLHK